MANAPPNDFELSGGDDFPEGKGVQWPGTLSWGWGLVAVGFIAAFPIVTWLVNCWQLASPRDR